MGGGNFASKQTAARAVLRATALLHAMSTKAPRPSAMLTGKISAMQAHSVFGFQHCLEGVGAPVATNHVFVACWSVVFGTGKISSTNRRAMSRFLMASLARAAQDGSSAPFRLPRAAHRA